MPTSHCSMAAKLQKRVDCYDEHAGYRVFLGADPSSAWQLQQHTQVVRRLTQNLTASSEVALLRSHLVPQEESQPYQPLEYATLTHVLHITQQPLRFYQQMLEDVALKSKL